LKWRRETTKQKEKKNKNGEIQILYDKVKNQEGNSHDLEERYQKGEVKLSEKNMN